MGFDIEALLRRGAGMNNAHSHPFRRICRGKGAICNDLRVGALLAEAKGGVRWVDSGVILMRQFTSPIWLCVHLLLEPKPPEELERTSIAHDQHAGEVQAPQPRTVRRLVAAEATHRSVGQVAARLHCSTRLLTDQRPIKKVFSAKRRSRDDYA
jgi:hypothetical protein